MKKLVKVANQFQKTAASQFSTFKEIAQKASRLYNLMPQLEKGFSLPEDVLRTKRVLNTLHSVAKQTLIDGLVYGISAKAASDYKNYLQMLTQWLMQMAKSQPHAEPQIISAITDLNNSIIALKPEQVHPTMGPRAPGYKSEPTPKMEEPSGSVEPKQERVVLPPGLNYQSISYEDEEVLPDPNVDYYSMPPQFR